MNRKQFLALESTRRSGLRAATAVCRDHGISDVTLWRWSKRGWIRTVNISGKVYVDLASLAEFERRAAQGEFAKGPHGAASEAAARAKANAEQSGPEREQIQKGYGIEASAMKLVGHTGSRI